MKTRPLQLTCALALAALAPSALAADKVAAVARVVPVHGLIELDGPAGDSVAEVRVHEGAHVTAGDVLLVLQSNALAIAELAHAEATLRELREQQPHQLKQAELAAQQAQTEAEFAQRTLARHRAGQVDQLAAQVFEQREHAARAAELRAASAKEALAATRTAQQTALARAEAQLAIARARVQRSTVNSPAAGTILQVDVQPGESTGRGRPLVIVADVSAMAVVADVFEGDLARVKNGQRATVASKSLTKPVTGKVTHVGRLIAGAGKTGRVTVTLDDATEASRIINAEVDLTIQP